jgi:GNAT superfamily N-acetyltransferase
MTKPRTRIRSVARTVTTTALIASLALTGAAIGTNVASAARTQPAAAEKVAEKVTGQRGQLVEQVPLRAIGLETLRTELVGEGFSDKASIRYGIQTYRLVYRTVDEFGRPTTASGLVALPDRRAGRKLDIVSYAHGTELAKADAPSVAEDLWGPGPAHAYAAAGFAAVAPDYLGLGVGPGRHPYLHLPSETTATIDLLKAARTFAKQQGRILTNDLYVTGFSQGATAATGLVKALHAGADRTFRVAALAPISGVYAFRHVELPALLSGEDVPNPKLSVGYTAYFLTSWNRMLNLYDDPSEVFQYPYDDGRIERVLDGLHSGQEILETIPDNVNQLYTKDAFAMMRNPTGRLAKALRLHDASCSDWTPRVPVRLLYGGADDQVLNANTTYCANEFRASRASVKVINLGNTVDHLATNRIGTAATVRWFSSLAR